MSAYQIFVASLITRYDAMTILKKTTAESESLNTGEKKNN